MATIVLILTILIFIYHRVPLLIWYIFTGIYVNFIYEANILFWVVYLVSATFLIIPYFRKRYIIENILTFIRKNGLVPKISQTEEVALQGGTNWVEADFFSNNINFDKIKNEKVTKLRDDEIAFLNNEVEELCKMSSDWKIFQDRDLSDDMWKYIKEKKFFGMIIPKEYGGLEFSATMHSKVIEKLVSRSQVLAITVMVPNSLGPAELILKHGTKAQQNYYLPRLANGVEVPCFALTEPNAGSDATSINSNGVLFIDNDEIKIRLNFTKRYITLANIATLIGLAFKLEDPDKILGDKKDLGITFALVSSDLVGVDNSNRHDPLNIPFVNSPIFGKDVIISLDDIVGGKNGIGKGWQMLVESLSIGRGISLPSVSLGGSKLSLYTVNAYSQTREQFGLSINKFEAIEEKIAKIASFTYLLNAARNYTLDAIDNGNKPAVVNSIMKYHATEKFRETINDAMDILGGAAIIRGEKNLLAHAYFAVPISITVEGANILTRNLMQFGQGLIKSHPYIYKEIKAIKEDDANSFDEALRAHISLVNSSLIKSIFYFFTRGVFIFTQKGETYRIKQKLIWATARFTFLTNLILGVLGPKLKESENISSKFADILSWLYLITSTLREYEKNEKKEDRIYLDYISSYGFNQIQIAIEEIYQNIIFLKPILPFIRLNSLSQKAEYSLNKKIVDTLKDSELEDNICDGIYIPKEKNEQLYRLSIVTKILKSERNLLEKIRFAIKNRHIVKQSELKMYQQALEKNIITQEEYTRLEKLYNLKQEIINVDYFNADVYKEQR